MCECISLSGAVVEIKYSNSLLVLAIEPGLGAKHSLPAITTLYRLLVGKGKEAILSTFSIYRGNEYDDNNTVVYYNSYDPNDRKREYFFTPSLVLLLLS